MSTNKIGGGSAQAPVQQAVVPVNKPTHGLPAGTQHGPASQFGGAVFKHGDAPVPPGGEVAHHRPRSKNLPLASQKKKQRSAARSTGSNALAGDDANFSLPENERAREQVGLAPVEINFEGRKDGDQSDGQSRDEKRFQNIFSLPALRSGKFTASSSAAAKARAVAATPLPPMQSLTEVLKFLHNTLQSDPSGTLARDMMRKISQSVLRNEMTLQTVRKATEARSLLVEAFGKGYQGSEPLSPLVRKLHLMLPIWLLNLGKTRTAPGRLQAAARLSLPHATLASE